MTQPIPIRQLVAFVAIAALSLSTALMWVKNTDLNKKNQTLLAETKKLQTSLDEIEEKNQALVDSMKKENETMKDSLESLKKENESLQADIQKNETASSSAQEEKTYLEEMLINKTKEIERLKNASPAQQAAPSAPLPSGTPEDITQRIRQKDDEIRSLSEQNKILSKKLEALYKTTNEKIGEINVAKIALEDTVSEARRKIDEEYNTIDLGSISVGEKTARPANKEQTRKTAKKEGRILAINDDHGFVVVDLGRIDNLSNDMRLAVKKNGETIATLSVLEVRDVMAACNVRDLRDGQKLQINDPVSVLK